jgi:hypothetical protein
MARLFVRNFVRTQCILLDTLLKLSVVPEGTVLGNFMYDVLINNLFICIKDSRYFLFVNIKIVVTISCATDCTLLQSDIDFLHV